MRSNLVCRWSRWQVEATRLMGEIQIHTAAGWVALDDIVQGQETCTICLAIEGAEGAGYVKCDPPELLVYLCRACRSK